MIRFIETWFSGEEVPDWCAVVIVCGKPMSVIATGTTEAELLANLDRESMRQCVPRTRFRIVDMRAMNALRRGAIETLAAIDRKLRDDRPAYLVNDGGGWCRERRLGCRIVYDPWPWDDE